MPNNKKEPSHKYMPPKNPSHKYVPEVPYPYPYDTPEKDNDYCDCDTKCPKCGKKKHWPRVPKATW